MSTYNVLPNAQQISNVYSTAYTLRNAGGKDVFLGTDTSVTPDSGMTLVRGASIMWDGRDALWACSKPGESSLLETLYNGDSTITDGATTVEIAGDVAIRGDINGNVNVTNAEINVGGIVANKVIGAVLVNGSFTPFLGGTTFYIGTSISAYQTISIAWDAGGLAAVSAVNLIRLTWTDPVTGTIVDTDEYYYAAQGSGHLVTAVKAGKLTAVAFKISSANIATNFIVSGSTAIIPDEYRSVNGVTSRLIDGSVDRGITDINRMLHFSVGTLTAGVRTFYYMGNNSGRARVYIVKTGSGTVSLEFKTLLQDMFLYYEQTVPAGIAVYEFEIVFPNAPVLFSFTSGAVGNIVNMTVIWE